MKIYTEGGVSILDILHQKKFLPTRLLYKKKTFCFNFKILILLYFIFINEGWVFRSTFSMCTFLLYLFSASFLAWRVSLSLSLSPLHPPLPLSLSLTVPLPLTLFLSLSHSLSLFLSLSISLPLCLSLSTSNFHSLSIYISLSLYHSLSLSLSFSPSLSLSLYLYLPKSATVAVSISIKLYWSLTDVVIKMNKSSFPFKLVLRFIYFLLPPPSRTVTYCPVPHSPVLSKFCAVQHCRVHVLSRTVPYCTVPSGPALPHPRTVPHSAVHVRSLSVPSRTVPYYTILTFFILSSRPVPHICENCMIVNPLVI